MVSEQQHQEIEVSQEQTVLYDTKDGIGFIVLNRSRKLNAQNAQMSRELLEYFKKAEADPSVKVVVFRGEGRAFCSGHDLKEASVGTGSFEKDFEDIEIQQKITLAIMNMGKPVVAAVQGYALGAGCELAMNCDIIIAAKDTKFGFPETSLGSAVGNGSAKLLPLLIGLARAREMMLCNRIIDADLAQDWGLVSQVVPAQNLLSETITVAEKMAKNSSLSVKFAKSAINQALTMDMEQTLDMELRNMFLTDIISRLNAGEKV